MDSRQGLVEPRRCGGGDAEFLGFCDQPQVPDQVVDAVPVDALRFLRLLDAIARAAELSAEYASLVAAMALWRGTPFEGLRSSWLQQSVSPRLIERYLAAAERRIDLGHCCRAVRRGGGEAE